MSIDLPNVALTQTIVITGGYNQTGKASYAAGGLYSLNLYNLDFTEFPVIDPEWTSNDPINIRLYDWDGLLMQYSDKFEKANYVRYVVDREAFLDYYPWSTCDMNGCAFNATAYEI